MCVLSVRASPNASDIQTASDASVKTASVASEVRSEVIAEDDNQLQSVGRDDSAGSPALSESARTAEDLSAVHSSSSVPTSPSLQHQQPTAEAPAQPSGNDQG